MALKTTLEQLQEVQTAITNCLAGQSVTINGKQITHPDLAALQNREQFLLERYRAEQGTGGPVIVRGIKER